jgi:Patatin-like phospholipase
MSYRILSLDGGGIWALIEVKALIALPDYDKDTPGHKVVQDFDLIAANSGGSIVLGALVENLTLGEILAQFEDGTKRKSIFSLAGLPDVLLHNLAENVACFVPQDSNLNLTGVVPKYSAAKKLCALQRTLPNTGDILLTEVTRGLHGPGSRDVHLLITAFDYDLNRAVFFRSSDVEGPQWGKGCGAKVTLAEAIHASTNAPVKYFDAPARLPHDSNRRYWDGAIAGCNNPVLAAVTEAIGKGKEPKELAVLSIGTGSVALPMAEPGQPPSPYTQPTLEPGIVPDLRKVSTSIIDDPPDVATFLAHVLTDSGKGTQPLGHSRIIRMSPLIRPVKKKGVWSAPGSMTRSQFDYLANLDLDAIEEEEVHAIKSYADLWLRGVAPNQPIRMNGTTLKPELGQASFKEAVAAWESLRKGAAAKIGTLG